MPFDFPPETVFGFAGILTIQRRRLKKLEE
jgi:hypothetical protein